MQSDPAHISRIMLGEGLYFSVIESKEVHQEKGFFFNTDTFLMSRNTVGKIFRFCLESNSGILLATMVVTVQDGIGKSPWMAPFGSVECIEKVEQGDIKKFISAIVDHLGIFGVKQLDVIHYPDFYQPEVSITVNDIYRSLGFEVVSSEVNQHIEIIEDDFANSTSYAQRKRLNKCKNSGFSFSKGDVSDLEEAHDLLRLAREKKGYPVTMKFKDLENMFTKHPKNYHLFLVRDKPGIIVMVVSIIINENILYNFYHAAHPDYQNYSPTVMAVAGVYSFCQQNGFQYLDLGISSSEGRLNKGLYKFKKELGARDSVKNKFKLKLN